MRKRVQVGVLAGDHTAGEFGECDTTEDIKALVAAPFFRCEMCILLRHTYAATSTHRHAHTKISQDRPLGLPQPSLSESVLPCAPGPRQTTSSWR